MHILATFKGGSTEADQADAVRSVNGWIDMTIPALGIARIALPGDANDAFGDGDAVARVLAAHPAVASAELDSTLRLTFDPNDAYYFTDPYVGLGQWGIRKALVDKAWDLVRGSPTVTVAVLDTGVDPAHPDLVGALAPGETFVSQPASACDPTSRKDDNSHGTHVAGVIGATGNNATGVAGVAFGVKVMSLKVLDCTGVGALSDVATGMVWAVDHGARIVNLSLGSPFDSAALRSAVTYAVNRNVLVVSAAGNCGTSGDRCTSLNQTEYPAAYPEVVSVGATDTDDSVASFSTRNATVGVSAPGRRIVSTAPTYSTYLSRRTTSPATPTYAVFSGTSQASPFVAGLAALILSADPTLTQAAVFERLRSTADDLGPPGRDDGYGFGRVNALRALSTSGERFGATYDTSALPKSAATGKAFTARIPVANTSSFTWRAADPSAVRLRWTWIDPLLRPLAGGTGTIGLAGDVAANAVATFTGAIAAPPAAGPFTLRLDLERGATPFSTKGVAPGTVAVTVGSGFGAVYAPTAGTSAFDAGAVTQVSVTLTNTGTETWPAGGSNPVRLAYHLLRSGATVVWDGQRALLPADVPTGGRVTLSVPVQMPSTAGPYTLRLDAVQEGVAWFSWIGVAPADMAITARTAYLASYALTPAPFLLPGGRGTMPITITNTGTATWTAGGSSPVRVAYHLTDAQGNVVLWDGTRTPLAADVAPGAKADLAMTVDAPPAGGAYRLRVDAVREGIAWFSGAGGTTADTDLLVVADYRAQLPGGPLSVSRADPVVQLTLKNTGVAIWSSAGPNPVNVGVHWYDAAGKVLLWDGARTPLPAIVAANASATIPVRLGAAPAGATSVAIDLVSEGIAWFAQGPVRPVMFTP
jgi:subtilisin family serine protease